MALDFPSSPSIGTVYENAGVIWTWDGIKWTSGNSASQFLPLVGGELSGSLGVAISPPATLHDPTLLAPQIVVGEGGVVAFNAFLGAGSSGWYYLATGYAGIVRQDTNGRLAIQIAPSGSAGASVTQFTQTFTFDQSGNFTAPGNVITAAAYYFGSASSSVYINWDGSSQIGISAPTNIFITSATIQVQGVLTTNNTVNAGGNLTFNGNIYGPSGGFTIAGPNNTTPNIVFITGTTVQVTGNFNVTGSTTTGNLIVNSGSIFHNHLYAATDDAIWCGVAGNAWYGVASYGFNQQSDPRFKKDLAPAPAGALALAQTIPVHNFHFLADAEEGPLHWGFLSTEVREAMGDSFAGWSQGEGEAKSESLSLMDMIAVLWAAVQELADATMGSKP